MQSRKVGGPLVILTAMAIIAVVGLLWVQSRLGSDRLEALGDSERPVDSVADVATMGSDSGSTTHRQQIAPPTPPPSVGATLTIRVVAASNDEPVENAALRLTSPAPTRSIHRHTTTDGTGAASISWVDVPAQPLVLIVEAAGFQTELIDLEPGRGGWQSEALTVRLARGAEIFGRVVDVNGAPIPEAVVGAVIAKRMPLSPHADPWDSFPETRSEGDGRFELVGLSATEPTLLIARKRGFLPVFSDPIVAGGDGVTLVLFEGEGSIHGMVLSPDGEPLAGVPVRATHQLEGTGVRNPRTIRFPDTALMFTRSDESGRYEFPAVRAGYHVLTAHLAVPSEEATRAVVLLPRQQTRKVNLRFRGPLDVSGIIVMAEDGTPVPEVRIAPVGVEPIGTGPVPGEVLSDEQGRFVIQARAVEFNTALVMPAVHYLLPPTFGHDGQKWRVRDLELGEVTRGEELRIEVVATVPVSGVVFEPDGSTPAAGVGVDFYMTRPGDFRRMEPPSRDPSRAEARTDTQGRYTVYAPALRPGIMVARRPDASAWTPYEVPRNVTAARDVNLTLRELVTVAGTITGPDGEPVPDLEVEFGFTADMPVGRMNPRMASMIGGALATMLGEEPTRTNAMGRYVREGVFPDPFLIRPAAIDKAGWIRPEGRITVPGTPLDAVDFQFRRGSEIRGIVVDMSAQAVGGARVSARPTGRGGFLGSIPPATTEADGSFVLAVPERFTTFNVRGSHPEHDDGELVNVDALDSPFTLVLRGRPTVALTVRAPEGAVQDFEYNFTSTEPTRDWGGNAERRNITGRAFAQQGPVLETISSGRYTVSVYPLDEKQNRDGRYGSTTIELEPIDGPTAPLAVEVEVGESITLKGLVVTLDDEGEERPLPDARVELRRNDGPTGPRARGTTRSAVSQKDGTFSFDYVATGSVLLDARLTGYSMEETVTLTVDRETAREPIKLVMLSTGRIAVTVDNADAALLRLLRVSMQRPSGQGFAFEDGATRLLPNVRPGDRAVVLHTAAGSIVERRRVEVLPGQQAEVTFDLAGWIRVNGRVTRDGGRIGDDAYVLSLVSVGEGGGWPSQDLVVSRGQYTQLLRPGTWDVHRDGIPTGERLVITDRPFEQQHDIDLLVTSLGVVILAPTGERLGGNMTLTWRERLGREGANFSRGVTSPRFFLDDIVPGWISAVYTAPDGTVYTADPTQVMRGEENILTLLPP